MYPDCNGILIVREGYSRFFGCSNYPNCKTKIGKSVGGKGNSRKTMKQLAKFMSDSDIEAIDKELNKSFDNFSGQETQIHCADDM